MPFCSNCGSEVNEDQSLCDSCAPKEAPKEVKETPKEVPKEAPKQVPKESTEAMMGWAVRPSVGVMSVIGTSLKFLLKKPFKLWGISVFHSFAVICVLIYFLPFFWFPFMTLLSYAVVAVLELGRISIFLKCYRGGDFDFSDLFNGFPKKLFIRNACGMGWMGLWTFLWFLVPVAGIVTGIVKIYSYRFTPYILNSEPDISAMDALKKSMKLTKGYRLKMFGVDILINVGLAVIFVILIAIMTAFSSNMVPVLPGLFAIIIVVLAICVFALYPLFMGVVQAAFYDKITRK